MAAAILSSSGSILLGDQILETYSDSLTSYQYTSATAIQAVRPQVTQRGVNLDGSMRLGSTLPMALAGNPFGDGAGWSGNRKLDSVSMNLGAVELTEVDLSLPAKGFSWVIGRSYNGMQKDSGGSHLDSNGYQGRNWFQMSQPEIVLYDDATNTKDVIYLVYGADRFLEFNRTGTSSNEYKGKNGAAGVVQFASGGVSEPDTFTYTDSVGNQFVFFGFDADASTAAGQFWKAVDPAGNTAFVGDATTGSTAISSGYSSGKILKAYDTSDRRYTYTYTTIDSVSRLTQVKAETKTSGTWASPSGVAEVGKVDSANVATFDRNALSVPARSDTALRTSYTYNTDGTTKEVTDPKGIVTRTEYDAMGRAVTVIRNYVNGTPSGTTADDDVITRNVFTNGLQTKLFVDLDGDNVEDATDQVTLYTYGTTKGASPPDSKVATGHFLQKVTYPDSSGGTDVVTYAYNAQHQEIYKKDQLTNVIQSDYDTGGRKTHTRVTTLTTGDGAVRRISLTYDSLSRVSLVTQYDNATVGSGSVVDEVKYTYDNWGPISKFEQDRNSAVGTGSDQYYVSYAYSKAGAGAYNSACTRRTIRKDTMKYGYGPSTDQATLTYEYLSTSGLHDDDLSRVTRVKLSTTALATYAYNGVSELVGTKYPEIDVWTLAYDPASLASFRDLDRFNRIAVSRWTKDLSTDVDFYNVSLAYDRNGNIIRAEDAITGAGAGYDVEYTNDNLNRLTKAEEGSWNGSAITSRSRQQIWTLTQTGNWDRAKLDLNGDNDFVDSGETDDTRTHNVANELTARDTDSNASNNYTLTYDDDGQLTDDGQSYKYVYDAFGRIRQVKNQSNTVIADYTYNGLGYRLGVRLDTDNDGDSDSNDTTFHAAYDERWRQVATFRSSDSSPKEQFINHQAGLDGGGGGSYIDTVICREKDANTAWTSASDGVLEERRYYCQNWRADVSAVLTSAGWMVEWVKYSSYGSPFGLPGGDANSSGGTDSTDTTQIQTWINGSAYDVRGDVDLDGDVDATDKTRVTNNYVGTTLGWNNLSAIGNRKGYAGYEWESQTGMYHVRHRVLLPTLGRWNRRDPLGYVDGVGLYEYVRSLPATGSDSDGLFQNLVFDPQIHTIAGGCAKGVPGASWKLRADARIRCPGDTYAWVILHNRVSGIEWSSDGGIMKDWGLAVGEFWEAWKIAKDNGYWVDKSLIGPDGALINTYPIDQASFETGATTTTHDGNPGMLDASASGAIFCDSEVKNTAHPEDYPGTWNNKSSDGTQIPSGLARSTRKRPSYWPDDESTLGFRYLRTSFDKYDCTGPWQIDSNASPAPKGRAYCTTGANLGSYCIDW